VPLVTADIQLRAFPLSLRNKTFVEQSTEAFHLESLGIVVAGFAHDFANLLTVIMVYGNLALESLSPDNHARELVNQVVNGADKVTQLTGQPLSCASKRHFELEPVDVSPVVVEVVNLDARFMPKWVELRLEMESEEAFVRADPDQIKAVLMNLVMNAAEAIDDDTPGTVVVRTSHKDIVEDMFANAAGDWLPPGSYVSIEVTDTGTGMDEETLSQVFNPQFTHRRLALVSARETVRRSKGVLRVFSEPARGITFEILLPAQPSQPRRIQAGIGEAPAPSL
jgi:two-component system, cell cycle sensor histidine kinase and response regulator CckA